MRADPPGRAVEEPRREVFSAALEQSEQLHAAAAACGRASQALPLFYSLSQGARAISAALGEDDGWELHGHGAGIPPQEIHDDVLGIEIEARKKGAFPLLSEITGSAPPSPRLSLGALLSSLPEVGGIVAPHTNRIPALELSLDHETAAGDYSMLAPPLFSSAVYFGPETRLAGDRLLDAMEARLALYPKAGGWVMRPTEAQREGRLGVGLHWPLDEEGRRGFKTLDVVATRYGHNYFLRPGLGADGSELNLLMTWWASLFVLSSLTRYEPALWRRSLDVDASSISVVLDEVLEVAQRRVPELIYETLSEERDLQVLAATL